MDLSKWSWGHCRRNVSKLCSFYFWANLLKSDILHFERLRVSKTTSRQKGHSKWCFWKYFRIQTKCICINVAKISILYLLFFALNVNKERSRLLQFFLNLSRISWKEIPGLYLHLPIFIFAYLPFTYNNSRFSLFAYFYIRNNRMSKSATAIYSFWPLPLPHCLRVTLNLCSNSCKLLLLRSSLLRLKRFVWVMICLGYVVTMNRISGYKTFILRRFRTLCECDIIINIFHPKLNYTQTWYKTAIIITLPTLLSCIKFWGENGSDFQSKLWNQKPNLSLANARERGGGVWEGRVPTSRRHPHISLPK